MDALEQRLLRTPADVFLLSLGPTATVLAARLSRHGRRAIDIGHLTTSYGTVFLGNARPEAQPVTPHAGEERAGSASPAPATPSRGTLSRERAAVLDH